MISPILTHLFFTKNGKLKMNYDVKKTRGGAREGASPPLKGKGKRKSVTVRLDPELIEKMKEKTVNTGLSQSDQLEEAWRSHFNFPRELS